MAHVGYVQVIYNYSYDYEGSQISIKKNDEFQLLAKSNNDWWHVRRWTQAGVAQDIYVPAVYVKEIANFTAGRNNDPTYENLEELQKRIKEEDARNGAQAKNESSGEKRSQGCPTILSKPKRAGSRKGHSNGTSDRPHRFVKRTVSVETDQSTINSEAKENGVATGSGASSGEAVTNSILQRLNQRPSNKDLSVETSPKHRTRNVNDPKSASLENNGPIAVAANKPAVSSKGGKIPPPVLPRVLQKPTRDRAKSMIAITSPTSENPPKSLGAGENVGVSVNLAERIAAVSAQLQHSNGRDQSNKASSFKRTISPQTSATELEVKAIDSPSWSAEGSPPVIMSAPPPPAPLPSGWTEHKTPSGHTYYYNSNTGQSLWTRPQPTETTNKTESGVLDRVAPRGWTKEINPITSTPIYTNSRTGERWTLARDGGGNNYYYNMSNPSLTIGELPEITNHESPSRSSLDQAEGTYDSLEPKRSKSLGESPKHSGSVIPTQMDVVALSLSQVLKKHGYLYRKRLFDSQGKKVKGGSQKLYVILENHELSFYTDHKVRDNPVAKPLSIYCLLQSTVCPYNKDKKKNVFQISSPFGEQFILQAETPSLTNDWYSTIQTAIDKANQEFKEDPKRFKSIGDFTLDGEDKGSAYRIKKPGYHKPGRQQSASEELEDDYEGDPMDDPEAVDRSTRIRNRLKKLMAKRPQMDQLRKEGIIQDPVFGCDLGKLYEREGTFVPKFFIQFMEEIEKRGIDVVGIYRLSGNAASVNKLRYLVDQDQPFDLSGEEWADINIVAGCLKLYLRELPDPVIPFRMFRSYIQAARQPTQEKRIQAIGERILELPEPNYYILKALIQHLRRVTAKGHLNKMLPTNVAIVFGPTIMRTELSDPLEMATFMPIQNGITEVLINRFDSIFIK